MTSEPHFQSVANALASGTMMLGCTRWRPNCVTGMSIFSSPVRFLQSVITSWRSVSESFRLAARIFKSTEPEPVTGTVRDKAAKPPFVFTSTHSGPVIS